jgi:hypothetical protein
MKLNAEWEVPATWQSDGDLPYGLHYLKSSIMFILQQNIPITFHV